ncbi:TIGR02450 family Trp-rich protein [Nostoc sp. PCC 7107]|uniref:TIGR02450 family Trp-rich protein n=1 Tax=Nostoc sp. PCC 7107 TaxID=317936 RepID=UPI00029EE7D9|nr:TIGR02450 family Trp-rich protein [Nostoc sp. PCC 7107]AFY42059.1 hypothetical protein Nos7107_1416 [Nostoc sp. PCC 7107]
MTKKQKFPYLVGSKWTAQQKVDGWRHFQVVNRKNQGKWVYAEMVASCDPNVRFWINAKLLQDRSQWLGGWQSLQEMEAIYSNSNFSETPFIEARDENLSIVD